MALYASVTGDAFATLVLILVAAPQLAAVALYMGPPEIFALICMAMTIIAGLGTKSITRGLIAAAAGVLVGTVGIEPVSALPRLTFGIVELERGVLAHPHRHRDARPFPKSSCSSNAASAAPTMPPPSPSPPGPRIASSPSGNTRPA